MSQIHASISIFALRSALTACVKFKIPNERSAGPCASDRRNTEGDDEKAIQRKKISIVLKYLLLKVKLRLKSQHAVRVF